LKIQMIVERIDANVVFKLLIIATQMNEDPDILVERALKEYIQKRSPQTQMFEQPEVKESDTRMEEVDK